MRRPLVLLGMLALMGSLLVPAFATEEVPENWTPTAGGFETGMLEYVSTDEFAVGGAMDATVHDGYLYVSHWRSFSIYDISDPLAPEHLSTTPLGPFMFNERPQTNGEILLVSGDFQFGRPGVLDIYDVRDKANPVRLSRTTFPALTTHIWECVDDCRYAYGTYGRILDLSDPAAPIDIGDWRDVVARQIHGYHTLRLVAADRLVIGSDPVIVLDVSDPEEPVELAAFRPRITVPSRSYLIVGNPQSLPARLDWPQDGKDPHLLINMETPFSGPCNDRSGDFQVYRAPDLDDPDAPRTFELVDRFALETDGSYLDGGSPYKLFGCGGYGMETAPTYAQDGLVATAWMEDGVRLLEVGETGEITLLGGFIPHAGVSANMVWPSDDVLYVIDVYRGIDILRVNRD